MGDVCTLSIQTYKGWSRFDVGNTKANNFLIYRYYYNQWASSQANVLNFQDVILSIDSFYTVLYLLSFVLVKYIIYFCSSSRPNVPINQFAFQVHSYIYSWHFTEDSLVANLCQIVIMNYLEPISALKWEVGRWM